MAKYDGFRKWFVAKCSQVGMPYEEFSALARRIMRIDVPLATFEMQRTYLKRRTPEQMAELDTASLSVVSREPTNPKPVPQTIPLSSPFGTWLLGRSALSGMAYQEFRSLAKRLLRIDVSQEDYSRTFANLRAAL